VIFRHLWSGWVVDCTTVPGSVEPLREEDIIDEKGSDVDEHKEVDHSLELADLELVFTHVHHQLGIGTSKENASINVLGVSDHRSSRDEIFELEALALLL
jgi:hypothetical protein